MLLKAIVNYISDDGYTANITIPVLDGYGSYVKSNVHGREAIICSLPGCKPSYGAGDVVFVSFEEDETSKPVVLGVLYRKEQLSQMDIEATSLQVNVNTILTEDVNIGDVSGSDMKNMLNDCNFLLENGSLGSSELGAPGNIVVFGSDGGFADGGLKFEVEDGGLVVTYEDE